MTDILEEGKKLTFLKNIEDNNCGISDDKEGVPILITFPYPYMNGLLHLGHLFTLSKAEFFSRFAELMGYKVLFPLSFHCTGMPISASAERLKDGDETIKEILTGYGFKDCDKFKDPLHWITIFPPLAIKSLKDFNANINFTKSFVTTKVNKIYDTFIKWQFNKLKDIGLLAFGKRYSIFCTKDNQPCLDHDRLKGEGILPKISDLFKIPVDGINFCIPFVVKKGKETRIYLNKKSRFILFSNLETLYLVEEKCYENIIHQSIDIKKIKEVLGCNIPVEFEERDFNLIEIGEIDEEEIKELDLQTSSKVLHTLNLTKNLLRFFEPEGEVISRRNSKCVVSLLDQWFIDYSNKDWKQKAFDCLEDLITTKETKRVLKEGIGWINKWGFSRTFGLGTCIPWDTQYLIDSLSDSTIYMALYTFYELLSDDLFGDVEFKEEYFDFIFSDILNEECVIKKGSCGKKAGSCGKKEGPCSDKERLHHNKHESHIISEELLLKCRNQLNTFYPPYLRVSGKDLSRNHLLFYIFNHVALFKKQYWPKRIETNGHLLLNSEKMSKSTGNFLTAEVALKKYGQSALRLSLAMCGDSNEDANFLDIVTNANILKIYNFIEMIDNYFTKRESRTDKLKPEEEFLIEWVNKNVLETKIAYKNFLFRDVIKYGLHEMLNGYDMFISLNGYKYSKVVEFLFENMIIVLYPIMPSICKYLKDKYFKVNNLKWPNFPVMDKWVPAIEYLKKIQRIINKKNKKNTFKKVTLGIGKKFNDWKIEVMDLIKPVEKVQINDNLLDRVVEPLQPLILEELIKEKLKEIFIKYEINPKIGMAFSMEYFLKKEKLIYAFDEFDILNDFKEVLQEKVNLIVEVVYDQKAEPFDPIIKFE